MSNAQIQTQIALLKWPVRDRAMRRAHCATSAAQCFAILAEARPEIIAEFVENNRKLGGL